MNRYIIRTSKCSKPLQANDLVEACFNACIELFDETPTRIKSDNGRFQGYDANGQPIGEPYTVVKS